jgi:hypothetical protein
MATTCVFLASKSQESFRPLEQIIRESHKEFYKTDIHPASEVTNQNHLTLQSFSKLKNTVLKCEMTLLQTLGFEFSAELPYSHLVKMYKTWKGLKFIVLNFSNIDKSKRNCVRRERADPNILELS